MDLRKAAELAEQRGKRIALRHLIGSRSVGRWEDAWDLVRAVDLVCDYHTYVDCILDIPTYPSLSFFF